MTGVPLHENHLFSTFFAPRGNVRLCALGMQIAQLYLSPFDSIIGVIGEAGSGKSMIIKGMFPGLELTNDDGGINKRPLPIIGDYQEFHFSAHTYHIDMRFESAFTQPYEIAEAVLSARDAGKRVIVEHFDMLYPFLKENADLLVGVGEEVIVTRPTIFGPLPSNLAESVFKSVHIRKMAHTAEDLTEHYFDQEVLDHYAHGDIRHGFILSFHERPEIDLDDLEQRVLGEIAKDDPVSYFDEKHIMIGSEKHKCTGPRMHVRSTGKVENFRLLKEYFYDKKTKKYMLVGLVGERFDLKENINKLW